MDVQRKSGFLSDQKPFRVLRPTVYIPPIDIPLAFSFQLQRPVQKGMARYYYDSTMNHQTLTHEADSSYNGKFISFIIRTSLVIRRGRNLP